MGEGHNDGSGLMPFKDTYRQLKSKFKSVFDSTADYEGKPPKQGLAGVNQFVSQMWEDGMKDFKNSFAATKESTGWEYSSPEEFYRACSKLEGGDHYHVYPSRTAPGIDCTDNSWKQELIDNEIQKQIRAKRNHITANWHDVVISPNISGINEIFDQERKITHWSEHVREWVSYAQNFGEVTVRSILNKTENPLGVADEITCEPGSVVRTPETKSIRKIDGTWYVVHGQRVNDSWVRENYPKFDQKLSDSGATPSFMKIDEDFKDVKYATTKMFNKLEAFLDDETLEEIPFDQGDFDQRVGQLFANIQPLEDGSMPEPIPVGPQKEDNHKKYIKAYLDWLDEKTSFYQQQADEAFNAGINLLPEDTKLANDAIGLVGEQIKMHEGMRSQPTGVPDGKRKKYPMGRYIVTLNGVLAEDVPNPYKNDWRKMFHCLKNEKVPLRRDGRGDVEILWQDNRILDTMLSRWADDGLLATHKKPWFKPEDKQFVEKDGYSTNPLKPGYSNTPPTFPTGTQNNQYLAMYNIVKGNTKESLSINQVTRGESSFAGESGTHAEALLNQNVIMVAGELNQNFNDFLEDVVETRISFYKEFYTEERPYVIDGQQVMLVLSDMLTRMEVEENGQKVYKDIGAIEVSVRPDSNFPDKDNREIEMLISLSKLMNEDGLPLIPSEMILDYIGKKFPSLAASGKYRRVSQLLALGKQAAQQQMMAQQQQAAQAQQGKTLETVSQKVQSKLTNEAANRILNGGNGNG